MDEDRLALWVRDAREYGFPALLTGFVLLVLVLGIPYWWAMLILAAIGSAVMVWTARATFGDREDE